MPRGQCEGVVDLGAWHDPPGFDILDTEAGPVEDPFRSLADRRKMAREHVQQGRPGGSA